MANYKSVRPGTFFCIPLFLDRTDWKLKQKLEDADMNKLFAFGRVIETSSSVLIEVFRKIGPANTDLLEVERSGVLFSPVQVFWDAVVKGRWRIIGVQLSMTKILIQNIKILRWCLETGLISD